ncbi:MAG: hypothetical protein ACO34J_16830 [Prochlorothrix sp.]
MANQPWWPDFLPRPRAWIQAIKLTVPAYLCFNLLYMMLFWEVFLVALIQLPIDRLLSARIFGSSFGILSLGLLWFLGLNGLYAVFLRLLWSNPPQRFRVPPFQRLVLRDFGILVLSALPLVLLGLLLDRSLILDGLRYSYLADPWALYRPRYYRSYYYSYRDRYTEFFLGISWAWVILAAYGYKIWLWLESKLSRPQKQPQGQDYSITQQLEHHRLEAELVALAGSEEAAKILFRSLVSQYPRKSAVWYYSKAIDLLKAQQ